MNENKKRILDMLAEGKITLDEATLLMDQLEDDSPAPLPVYHADNAPAHRSADMMLRVRVIIMNEDRDKPMNVSVNLPLKAARIAGNIVTKMMPEQARDALEDEGIDLSDLNLVELIDALAETGGDIVNINHEDDESQVTVRVYIE